MQQPATMLEVQGLSVSYGDLPALRSVSFSVKHGELVTIVGPNGAGKTTTLRTVLGLIKPNAGRILFQGKPIDGEPTHRRVRAGLALVPEGRHIFPYMTVEENIELGAFPVTGGRGRSMEQVFALFPRLAERRRQLAGTLSGGEQQMLAIGRSFLSRPKLLMLDEPSLGLAPLVIDGLYQTILDMKREGLTILLVEQYVFGALTVADRAYVLETGRIVREGASERLLSDDYFQKTYLAI